MERGQTPLNVTKAVISDDGGCAALLAALQEQEGRGLALEASWRGRRACPAADAEPA